MADYKAIIPSIKREEGGLSKAKTDTASKYPVPDGSGYHTNKGITWQAFESFQKRLALPDVQSLIKAFYQMPETIWEKVYKWGYWDVIRGDEIKSQAVADILVDWAWGAGPGTAVKKMRDFLAMPAAYVMDVKTLQAINAATSSKQAEADFVTKLAAYKRKWYLSLPNQEANYKGWAARLDRLYEEAIAKVGKSGTIIGGLVIGGSLFFLAYKLIKAARAQS